jgi:hypothetical protein
VECSANQAAPVSGSRARCRRSALVRLVLALEVLGLAGLGFIARTDSPWWTIATALFV